MGKAVIYYILLMLLAIGSVTFFIVKNVKFDNPYDMDTINNIEVSKSLHTISYKGYQSEYAVIPDGNDVSPENFSEDTYAALLVDNTNKEALVSYNSLRRIYPASTTKLMTAIVVCDALYKGEISLDDQITLQHDTSITEEGALVSQLKSGCTITVRNLLYGLLMKSYNDFAVILAEYVGGSEAEFANRMNAKAYEIGATGSHFVNPHGLHDDNHYITAYDMYLILQEAEKYDIIREIDSYNSFTYSYTTADGQVLDDDITPTNQFLSGTYKLPSNITIDSWKTGTTKAAGNILALNVTIDNNSYSIFVADSVSQDDLYDKIGIMFNLTK
ncbi:MAG: D-alanyl-D-alanine carboxypeptidase [Eubacterium sp.]|nr:D-alanyl-D-alanine carboxypeptidase [Eubacterium sp.]